MRYTPWASLNKEELTKVNQLVPCLCDAVRLLNAYLLAGPPLASLPIPTLINSLVSHPNHGPTMALLTALKYNPRHPFPLPFCSPLLSTFFEKCRLKEAAKVFAWLYRPDSPCQPDPEIYQIVIGGFCRLGRMVEALRAVKAIVEDGVSSGTDLREAVFREMLWEARINKAGSWMLL